MPLIKDITQIKCIIENLVHSLKVNVSIVNSVGDSILIPNPNPYGWELLADTTDFISKFKVNGEYLEHTDIFNLSHFAIPVDRSYIVLGPLVINKRLERSKYEEIASKLNRDNPDEILECLEEVRVVSNIHLKHILDLIRESKDLLLSFSEERIRVESAQLKASLHSLLGLALQASKAQSGSIMLFDLKTNELSIQASEGLKDRYLHPKPLKLGEGISGLALKEGKAFILGGKDLPENNRISHLLKREEIKQSIVLPFENSVQRIRGVINLNIEKESNFLSPEEATDLTRNLSLILNG